MLTKVQIALGIVAGVAIVVFFVAIMTNAQVKNFETVPGWQPMVVWAAFGIVIVCSIGVIVAQVLELRPPKEKKEAEPAEGEAEAPAEEMATVGAVSTETAKEEGEHAADLGTTEAIAEEPSPLGDFPIETSTTEGFKSEFEDLSSDFNPFEDEK
jgi:type VI protein secretion system component VasK